MMAVSKIIEKMIVYFAGIPHEVQHFMKVWGYAKVIGELERLDEHTQLILEIAAVTHDIACPLCREKYGSADGKLQELEGPKLVADFLKDTGLSKEDIDRISFLVGHHHTYSGVDNLDYQILLEADYLVNAQESGYATENIRTVLNDVFKTETGKHLLKEMYSV